MRRGQDRAPPLRVLVPRVGRAAVDRDDVAGHPLARDDEPPVHARGLVDEHQVPAPGGVLDEGDIAILEKLAEGIRRFAADVRKLEDLLAKELAE